MLFGDAAKELVDQREKDLIAADELNPSTDLQESKSTAVYLTYLLSNKSLTRDEIYASLMELMIAGTDTVGHLKHNLRPLNTMPF